MGVLDRPKKDAPWRNGVYLTTAKTSFEADIIASKLEAEGIPCVKNYRGASNFMEVALGSNSIQDIEIFVPESTIDKAREALITVPIDDDFEEAGDEEAEGEGDMPGGEGPNADSDEADDADSDNANPDEK